MGLDTRTLGLIATVIEHCEGPSERGPGHPPAETVRVLAALRRFLREGTPWRSLRATLDSGQRLDLAPPAARTGRQIDLLHAGPRRAGRRCCAATRT